jgi:hypothetical protein
MKKIFLLIALFASVIIHSEVCAKKTETIQQIEPVQVQPVEKNDEIASKKVADEYIDQLSKGTSVDAKLTKLLSSKEEEQRNKEVAARLEVYFQTHKILRIPSSAPIAISEGEKLTLEDGHHDVVAKALAPETDSRFVTAVLEHLKYQTIYKRPNLSKEEVTQAIGELAQEYMSLESALAASEKGNLIAPYIVVKAEEVSGRMNDINRLFKESPESVLVVDCGDANKIGDKGFCRYIDAKNKTKYTFPQSVHKVSFVGPKVTKIESSFLDGCKGLISVDLRPLRNLEDIGDYFLSRCSGISTLDLTGLDNIKSIGKSFLSVCTDLKKLDLSAFKNLTDVGSSFLYNCTNLAFLDISGFGKVEKLGYSFLSGCRALKSVDLSSLNNLQTIEGSFLRGCESITDLDSLPNVIKIEGFFLDQCTNLKTINLSALKNVISIGNSFLSECKNLTAINLSPLGNVTRIGNEFLAKCTSIKSVDLSDLDKIRIIGHGFLSGCTALTSVDISGLSNIESVGDAFLFDCSSLPSIDLKGLSNITKIGNEFLAKCKSLATVDLSPLSKLKSIGESFLHYCKSLTSLDLNSLGNLESIGKYFLSHCEGITSINVEPLGNLKKVGDNFLYKCTDLNTLNGFDALLPRVKELLWKAATGSQKIQQSAPSSVTIGAIIAQITK